MIGKIFITRNGYDPANGKYVKDPYLGDTPSLGACRTDVRKKVQPGDHIFVISGKMPRVPQFIMGGFEVAKKISAVEAYSLFPEQRLSQRDDGQLAGNVIVDLDGKQHPLDNHSGFAARVQNYVVGQNPVVLASPEEIARGRKGTLNVLQHVFRKTGSSRNSSLGTATIPPTANT